MSDRYLSMPLRIFWSDRTKKTNFDGSVLLTLANRQARPGPAGLSYRKMNNIQYPISRRIVRDLLTMIKSRRPFFINIKI
jgi:hypothetical protein